MYDFKQYAESRLKILRYKQFIQYKVEDKIVYFKLEAGQIPPYKVINGVKTTVEWIEAIGRVYNRVGLIVYSRFDFEITLPRTIMILPFSREIKRLIKEKKAMEACNVSAKDRIMGGY